MFKVGDFVRRKMSAEEAQRRVDEDNETASMLANKSGRKFKQGRNRGSQSHIGKASSYMHTNEPYEVQEVTPEGGLRLAGFTLTVAQDEVELASPEDARGKGLRWGR